MKYWKGRFTEPKSGLGKPPTECPKCKAGCVIYTGMNKLPSWLLEVWMCLDCGNRFNASEMEYGGRANETAN